MSNSHVATLRKMLEYREMKIDRDPRRQLVGFWRAEAAALRHAILLAEEHHEPVGASASSLSK